MSAYERNANINTCGRRHKNESGDISGQAARVKNLHAVVYLSVPRVRHQDQESDSYISALMYERQPGGFPFKTHAMSTWCLHKVGI